MLFRDKRLKDPVKRLTSFLWFTPRQYKDLGAPFYPSHMFDILEVIEIKL